MRVGQRGRPFDAEAYGTLCGTLRDGSTTARGCLKLEIVACA